MSMTIKDEVGELAPQLIADRRYLHQHPELSTKEFETAAFVADRLRSLGIEITTGVAGTGVVGLLHGASAGKTVMLRADMDALPIEEENDVPYRSQVPGVMHACGHDGHTSMLLGVAHVLSRHTDKFSGTVKFVFQPSEELPPGGAKPMIDAGVLRNPDVDAVFGLHIGQDLPVGTVGVSDSVGNAASDNFIATILGQGGHAARPHLVVDPGVIACQVVTTLQLLISREIDPQKAAVITVGSIHAGETANVIPSQATLKGTVRTFDEGIQDYLSKRVPEVIHGITSTLKTEAKVDYKKGYPPLLNDLDMVKLVRETARTVVGDDMLLVRPPSMGSEDFSYYLREVPGCFIRIGSKNEAKGFIYAHHHPKFDFDDEVALPIGVETLSRVAINFLKS